MLPGLILDGKYRAIHVWNNVYYAYTNHKMIFNECIIL